MDAQAIITVSAAVVALVQLVKWAGLTDSKGPLAVLALSSLGVAVWTYDQRAIFTGGLPIFELFAGWIAVATSAAGVFGFTRATGEGLTKMKGTGNGLGIVFLAAVLGTSVVASGCATSAKQRVVTGLQGVNKTVDTIRTAEMSTFDAGIVQDLTPERHKAFHAGLVKYYDAEIKIVELLQAWRSGEAPPAGLAQQLRIARDALTEVSKALPPSGMQTVVTNALAATTSLIQALAIIEGV